MNRFIKEAVLFAGRQALSSRGTPKSLHHIGLARLRDWGSVRFDALWPGRHIYRGVKVVWPSEGQVELECFELTSPRPGKVLVKIQHTVVSPS